jgi:hypothetical protein
MARRFVAFALCSVLATSGCGAGQSLSADAPYFEGLDSGVVAEVLVDPVARQKIEEEPEDTRESMAQGIAINFMVCRDALRVYEDWIGTGVAPDLNPLPVPARPREPSYSDWETTFADLEARLASGEIEQLRFWLTAEGSCGQWIPALPGDPSGPTIKDAVEGAT